MKGVVAVSSFVRAPSKRVYAILSDYHKGHPAILPRAYFKRLEVKQGGNGAGTVMEVEMAVMGTRKIFTHKVREPEPGRVLVEYDPDGSLATTFTVDPRDNDNSCVVTFSTEFSVHDGLYGRIERFVMAIIMKRIYRKELAILAQYAIDQKD